MYLENTKLKLWEFQLEKWPHFPPNGFLKFMNKIVFKNGIHIKAKMTLHEVTYKKKAEAI